jgi:hypothetical protein
MSLSIYQKHQSIFTTEEDKYNVNLNMDQPIGSGHIESILISWRYPVHEYQYNYEKLYCYKSKRVFDPNTHWHCDLCCIQNKCHIVNNGNECNGCTCYTNIATDYDLENSGELKYTYVWKTHDGHIFEVEEYVKTDVKFSD